MKITNITPALAGFLTLNIKNDIFGNIRLTHPAGMGAHLKFVRFDQRSHMLLTFHSVALLSFQFF
jgi:hypothetical protein